MPFSESTITSVAQPVYANGQVFLSWTCSISGPSVWFQLYLNGVLAHWTQATSCWLPTPSVVDHLDIGTVNAGEEQTSFASSLPSAPQRTVTLTWLGGTFEAIDLAGFRVYGETTPSGGISYTTPLATITAYPAGLVLDGYGLGGYGLGGYGEAASSFSWTSAALTSGTWHWSVIPYDAAGNAGTAALTSQTIAVPPSAPPLFSDGSGTRLHYTYSASTHEATLTWLASLA